jgi:hypothetical protein
MAQKYEVDRPTAQCAVSGRKLEEGEDFYTVLFEEGESFRRADYALDSWTGPPEGSFCHFKTRIAPRQPRKRVLADNDMLVAFFLRLQQETEEVRVQFRFVLALLLMQKRALRYDNQSQKDGVEIWRMTLMKDRSEHDVVNPRLTEDQIEGVSRQLTAILHGDLADEILAHEQSEAEDLEDDGDSAGNDATAQGPATQPAEAGGSDE